MIENIVPVVLVKDDAYWLPYCLESVAGWFNRMVIYDVGSTDGTVDIINWYIEKETHRTDFTVRLLPFVSPAVQGTFRNSMIVETKSDAYFILDADELYNAKALQDLQNSSVMPTANRPYGVIRRIEIGSDLKERYSEERTHHRLYHRTASWMGSHPGEVPVIPQNRNTEFHLEHIKCLHMHNTLRSPKDEDVPKRLQRRSQHTYHPGQMKPFNLLEEYPLLQNPIADFEVSPILKELQNA